MGAQDCGDAGKERERVNESVSEKIVCVSGEEENVHVYINIIIRYEKQCRVHTSMHHNRTHA